jgi:hypothetical protein
MCDDEMMQWLTLVSFTHEFDENGVLVTKKGLKELTTNVMLYAAAMYMNPSQVPPAMLVGRARLIELTKKLKSEREKKST